MNCRPRLKSCCRMAGDADNHAAPGEDHGHDDFDGKSYSEETIGSIIAARVGWLQVFFIGLLFVVVIMAGFEETIKANPQLSFFVPLIIGHAGNTGSQSVSTIIRALALDEVKLSHVWKVVLKESISGASVGLFLGMCVYFGAFLIELPERVALAVALSLPVCSWVANLTGSLIPILCVQIDLDPAVIAAPLMTTIVDCAGIAAYLAIAGVCLGSKKPTEKTDPCAAHAVASDAMSLNAVHVVMGIVVAIVLALLVYGTKETVKERKLANRAGSLMAVPDGLEIGGGEIGGSIDAAAARTGVKVGRHTARGRGSFSLDPREAKRFARRVRDVRESVALMELEAAEKAAAAQEGGAAVVTQKVKSTARVVRRRLSTAVLNVIMTENGLAKTTSRRLNEDAGRTEALTPRPGAQSPGSSPGDSPALSPVVGEEDREAIIAIRIAEGHIANSAVGISSTIGDDAANIAFRTGSGTAGGTVGLTSSHSLREGTSPRGDRRGGSPSPRGRSQSLSTNDWNGSEGSSARQRSVSVSDSGSSLSPNPRPQVIEEVEKEGEADDETEDEADDDDDDERRQAQAKSLTTDGERHMQAMRYGEAVASFEAALALDSANTELQDVIALVKGQLAQQQAEANGTMAAAADSEVEEVTSAQNPLHARSQQGSLSLELEGGFVCDDDV